MKYSAQTARNPVWRAAIAGFIALIALSFILCTPTYAAVPKLEQIRVALLASDGKTLNTSVPAVTLSAQSGFDIGARAATSMRSWLTVPANAKVRLSSDGYKVLLVETADSARVKLLMQALGSGQDKPYIFRTSKLGRTVYQAYAGMYASVDEAQAAAQRLSANATVAAQLSGAVPSIAGPLHLSAGTYASEAEADQQSAALRQLGVDAWTAVVDVAAADKLAYQVWLGEAADSGQLAAASAQAAKLAPGAAVQPVDAAASYLLKRDDVTASMASGPETPIAHYTFNPAGSKLLAVPKDGGIAIAEKSGRRYRGSIELSVYNNKLAVVNELPFEQYLVSVVGAEMSPAWPAEALKAQAVTARSFALSLGNKYAIANVSDSTADQVYYGIDKEDAKVAAAVSATAGELLTANGALITPFFYSNGGGMTGDPVEVWGQPNANLKATASPDDGASKNKPIWYNVLLPSGVTGYVRQDFITDTGEKNGAGLPVVTVKGNSVNVRAAPYVDDTANGAIGSVNQGSKLVALGKTTESNEYAWIRGPYKADALLKEINLTITNPLTGKLESLEVSKRGPSGRATELTANGKPIAVAKSDQYRTALFDAPSTRFEIEQTGRYTVWGAGGQTASLSETSKPMYAASSFNGSAAPVAGTSSMVAIGAAGAVRAITKDTQFRLTGYGFGHGLGMSQWGARGLAEQGYDYKRILQHYYLGITIGKE